MNRLLICMAAVALAVGTMPASAQTEITFSTWVPANHPINKYVFEVWGAEVEKATKGSVKFRILAKPIAAPNQHYDAVVKGQVDAAYATYGYQPERFMPYLIAELPALGETAVHNGVALWRTHKAHIEKAGIHNDVQLLGTMTHGPGMMHHSKKLILNPDDLKGQKVRVGGDVPKAIIEAFGGVVITQPAPKSYEILSAGIADGIMFPTESLKSFNIANLVTNTTFVKGGLYSSSFWFAINKDKWAKFTKDQQDAINKVSGEAFARLAGAGWDRADREGVEAMKAAGGKMEEMSPLFVAELRKLTDKMETDYAGKMDKMGLNGKEVIRSFRAEVAKVAAGN
ncbi:MAG: TRAP transporter substrate-binding protein [Betaproteobacteria bacterium]|nr:TRAP transporter substrate-binding protein [Betaproteobacteria bacterium]